MTTTLAIVEILVIGFFAALWMLPCIALLSDIRWDRILIWARCSSSTSSARGLANNAGRELTFRATSRSRQLTLSATGSQTMMSSAR